MNIRPFRRLPFIALAAALTSCAIAGLIARSVAAPAEQSPRPIRVLFLGDKGHHKPAERYQQLLPYLTSRGIEIRYTESADDLNPKTLGEVDALLLFANTESITPDQEKALLDYVNKGGGFVPVHSASYCFLNSPKFIDLVGAQFKSHGGEVFKAKITEPAHPAMLGLDEFASWDETYVHHRHNTDRKVLMVREQKDAAPEPYTWTREVGKGRVFYTALGHDERTWGEMGFLRLLENGIRWVAKQESTIPGAARNNLPPLAYVPAKAPIPFYPPSEKWGTQAEPLKEMQAPLEPAESLKYLELPDGFHAELFAAEPDIVKVVAMAWDERGRLWVSETIDYPNDLQPPGKGNDRIKICEDTNNDGKADKFTIFADKLSIPTSLVFANGGLIVTQAPDTLFFKDTNGDDKADVRTTLFTGWKTNDTHAGPSNLRYGLDNWIWGTVGYAGFEGSIGGKAIRFGQGIFRFKPDGSAMEFLTSTSNNTWGLGLSETGDVFASTANNQHSVHLAIPNRYYESVRGWHGLGSAGIADHRKIHPVTEHHRQMDWHGGFTAAAGHALYTARAYPERYWNKIAFVTEGTGHLVHQNVLEPAGSTFIARDGYNLLASHDEWTSPVVADVGPDGTVWVSDWYNYIFQHNPTPQGFQTGKGNAYVTPLRDKVHGRVYRIVPDGMTRPTAKQLTAADPAKLVEALRDDNLFWRLTAQRLLIDAKDPKTIALLQSALSKENVDAIQNDPGMLHALWTLNGLGESDEAKALISKSANQWLKHSSPAFRRAAIQTLPRSPEMLGALLSAGVLRDADAQVRLAALLKLSEMPADSHVGAELVRIMSEPENARDKWIPDAAIAAAAQNDISFLLAALDAVKKTPPAAASAPAAGNLVPNGSFEQVSDDMPIAWELHNWQGKATAGVEDNKPSVGEKSLRITAPDDGADSSVSVIVTVKPKTNYRLSARVRTQDLKKGSGMGALLNIHELQNPRVMTKAVNGTTDWTAVETTFNSGDRTELTLNCLLGGWGRSTGVAWFDDVQLSPADGAADTLGNMIRVVTTHYASRGPSDSVVTMLSSLNGAEDATTAAVLDGLLAGWPKDAEATLKADKAADDALLAVSKAISKDNRARMATLAQRFGRGELFAEETAAAQKELVATLANEATAVPARLDAARRLLALGDTAANVDAILKRVTPQSPPPLASGLISAISSSRQDAAGEILLKKWNTLPPSARKAAVDVLLRRAAWHGALLDAMEKGSVTRGDLSAEQAQQLVAVAADPAAAERAEKLLSAAGRLPDADRQKMLDKLLPLADLKGDVAAGKAVYEKNCAACHVFAGAGGKVGPELTGIGKNPRHEVLLNILDPNRSVEGNYRLWIIQTKDGQTLSGRLDTESQTTVELLDATGKQQVVQRKDIRRMASMPTSIMPEGFELLPPEELTNLVEYLVQPPPE